MRANNLAQMNFNIFSIFQKDESPKLLQALYPNQSESTELYYVCYNLTSAKTYGLRLNTTDAFLYLDALVRQPPSNLYAGTQVDADDSSMSSLCYESTLVEDILNTGYWYELCNEMQTAYEKSHSPKTHATIEDGIVYFSQLYQSQEVYLALKIDTNFRNTVYGWC